MNPLKQLTSFLKKKFGKTPIESGQVWVYSDDVGNPFVEPRKVKILGFKNGWVKYQSKYGAETMKESSFRYLYRFI